jgi:hypothetical protein
MQELEGFFRPLAGLVIGAAVPGGAHGQMEGLRHLRVGGTGLRPQAISAARVGAARHGLQSQPLLPRRPLFAVGKKGQRPWMAASGMDIPAATSRMA